MTQDGFVTAEDEAGQGGATGTSGMVTEVPEESEQEGTGEKEQDEESDRPAKGASEGTRLLDRGVGIVAGKVDDMSYV